MEIPRENVEEFSRERLMEEIRRYPCIYDKYDKDYPDKNAKNHAWAAISAKYGITPMEADKKYKTIRSSFTRYLKKKRNTPPGIKPPPLPLAFLNLDWLASHIDHKETAACTKYVNSNGGKNDGYYSDYLPDGEDAYHSSYGEIMREESHTNEVIELPNSSVTTRSRESLKPEPVPNHVLHVSTPRENLRPDPLPTPILHVSTSECQSSRVTSPPISNHGNNTQTSSNQTPQANGPKSITMYYNRPKTHESPNDTVLNLIPLESVQPTSSTSTPPPSETSGKRKRIEYDDEDELFCLSLVPTLKRLGPRNKTIAKMRFQQVLFDLEFPANE